jgi:hypothetical protein
MLLALPFGMLSMCGPLAIPAGIVGIFWHPFHLPTGLNALAMAGAFLGTGLLGFAMGEGLMSMGHRIERDAQERGREPQNKYEDEERDAA